MVYDDYELRMLHGASNAIGGHGKMPRYTCAWQVERERRCHTSTADMWATGGRVQPSMAQYGAPHRTSQDTLTC